jgi:hypothetical protein
VREGEDAVQCVEGVRVAEEDDVDEGGGDELFWIRSRFWDAACDLFAAVGEGERRGIAEVGDEEMGGEVVEEGYVVYLAGLDLEGGGGRGTDLSDLAETYYTYSEDLLGLARAC